MVFVVLAFYCDFCVSAKYYIVNKYKGEKMRIILLGLLISVCAGCSSTHTKICFGMSMNDVAKEYSTPTDILEYKDNTVIYVWDHNSDGMGIVIRFKDKKVVEYRENTSVKEYK